MLPVPGIVTRLQQSRAHVSPAAIVRLSIPRRRAFLSRADKDLPPLADWVMSIWR